MKSKDIIPEIKKRLYEEFEKKNSWGKNEVKEIINTVIYDVSMELINTILEEQDKAFTSELPKNTSIRDIDYK